MLRFPSEGHFDPFWGLSGDHFDPFFFWGGDSPEIIFLLCFSKGPSVPSAAFPDISFRGNWEELRLWMVEVLRCVVLEGALSGCVMVVFWL